MIHRTVCLSLPFWCVKAFARVFLIVNSLSSSTFSQSMWRML